MFGWYYLDAFVKIAFLINLFFCLIKVLLTSVFLVFQFEGEQTREQAEGVVVIGVTINIALSIAAYSLLGIHSFFAAIALSQLVGHLSIRVSGEVKDWLHLLTRPLPPCRPLRCLGWDTVHSALGHWRYRRPLSPLAFSAGILLSAGLFTLAHVAMHAAVVTATYALAVQATLAKEVDVVLEVLAFNQTFTLANATARSYSVVGSLRELQARPVPVAGAASNDAAMAAIGLALVYYVTLGRVLLSTAAWALPLPETAHRAL
jgi:hypothetical protein